MPEKHESDPLSELCAIKRDFDDRRTRFEDRFQAKRVGDFFAGGPGTF